MGTRNWILIGIDLFFCLGLLELIIWGGSAYFWTIIGCMAMIAYVTWSIMRLTKAKPPAAPK